MKRPFILSLLVSGLGLVAPLSQAETLPLPLTGPAYAIANEAYMAYNRKDYDLAIAKAREALRQRADADQLRDLIALAERDKYRRDHPARFPKARPKPGYLEGNQALRAYANRDYDGSASHARKAIAQAPKNLDYRMMLIEALQRQQRLDEAQAAINEAEQALGPQQVLTRRRQAIQEQVAVDKAATGYKALARGDNDTAVSEAREAVRSFPKQMAYRKLLVSALIAQGQYAEARSAATEALALNGNDATLLVQRGQMRQRLGDQDGARQDFAQAMAVGNLPLREQASLYAAMGQPSEALQRLQQARDAGELQPGDEVQIAYFLSQAGDDQGALDTFKRVDRQSGLKPREVQDAAYSAMRTSDDAQAIAGTDVLQTAGSGSQAQIHRDGRLERCRPAPVEARLQQDAGRVAEACDDGRLARTHLHQARCCNRKRDQHRSQACPPPGKRCRAARAMMMVVMTMAAMAVTVMAIVVGVIVMMMEQTQGTTPY
ncbi:Peptidase aspartic, active site protein [Pseudomonas syringae pv. aceris]|nr:Peptidase aspartic, active site protein [Pseudomonas syringae pv. aceris]